MLILFLTIAFGLPSNEFVFTYQMDGKSYRYERTSTEFLLFGDNILQKFKINLCKKVFFQDVEKKLVALVKTDQKNLPLNKKQWVDLRGPTVGHIQTAKFLPLGVFLNELNVELFSTELKAQKLCKK